MSRPHDEAAVASSPPLHQMDLEIRGALLDDWPEVQALLVDLGRPDARQAQVQARESYETYLRRDDAEALVATVVGEVSGFVNIEYRPRLNYASEQGWIAELIVSRQHRRVGIGSALLGAVEARARSRGCWGVALESANWRADAHRFYEREGWSQTSLAFTKALDAAAGQSGDPASEG